MQDEPSVNDQLVFTLPNEITMKTGGLPHQLTWSLKLLTKAPDETSEYWKFAKVAKILQANFRIKLPKNIPESKEFDQSFLELKRQARLPLLWLLLHGRTYHHTNMRGRLSYNCKMKK